MPARARRAASVVVSALLVATGAGPAVPVGSPPGADHDATGAVGIGDPYFPKYGNGGYDVRHYRIAVAYQPKTGRLTGRTTVRAVAKKRLRRFNLDLQIRAVAVRVRHRPARFVQRGRELTVWPRRPLREGRPFRVVVTSWSTRISASPSKLRPDLSTRASSSVASPTP
ncbi:MAG TPA: hypothetical protein VEX15_07210 [Nocardioidaceae bacterium]|nr:hypothetical protein [Nocardioidaceae bacterium]